MAVGGGVVGRGLLVGAGCRVGADGSVAVGGTRVTTVGSSAWLVAITAVSEGAGLATTAEGDDITGVGLADGTAVAVAVGEAGTVPVAAGCA